MQLGGLAVSGGLLCVATSEARGRLLVVDLDEGRTVSAWEFAGPDGGFADAAGVCLDESHHIFVADPRNDLVLRFSPFGRSIGTIGRASEHGHGSVRRDRPGVLDAPHAVLVVGDRLWVAGGTGRIRRGVQWFSASTGEFGGWLRAFGDREGEFGAPRGLASSGSDLFVADTLHGTVQRFRIDDGRFVGSFRTAADPEEASRPGSLIAVEAGDGALRGPDLLVVEQGDRPGLRRFRLDGAPRPGWEPDPRMELDHPHALATDGVGRVYVLDRDGQRVQRMHPDLTFDRLIVDLAEIAP